MHNLYRGPIKWFLNRQNRSVFPNGIPRKRQKWPTIIPEKDEDGVCTHIQEINCLGQGHLVSRWCIEQLRPGDNRSVCLLAFPHSPVGSLNLDFDIWANSALCLAGIVGQGQGRGSRRITVGCMGEWGGVTGTGRQALGCRKRDVYLLSLFHLEICRDPGPSNPT